MAIIKVKTGGITADAITDALIADDVVGTEHLTANEVDTTALGADAVTAAQIADDAISEEHLDATAITGMTELAAEPADTDEFLISDAGTLKRIDYSHIKGGGKVLQVISASKNDTFTTTSTSFVDVTGLTADIAPASTSNKVLVTVLLGRLTTDDGGGVTAELNRGGSSIYDLGQGGATDGFAAGGGGGMSNNDRKNDVGFIQYLDSPSSTSSLTYKIRIKRASSGSAYINRWGLNDDQGAVSSITLMEIAG